MGKLRALGIKGVACWDTGSTDYNAADHMADNLWDAFAAFADPRKPDLNGTVAI
jgi:hypothetical protein